MKLAVLSDAHGNWLYFERCISEIKKSKPDKIVFLGDCFGYMHEGKAVLDKLREMNAKILLGNHEAMLSGKIPFDKEKEKVYGLEIDRLKINTCDLEYIKKLSPEFYEEIDNKRILYIHGRPDNFLCGYLYKEDRAYRWGQDDYDFIFMGHTHRPYIKKAGTVTYVNVGSCGLPRDKGRLPSYAVLDTKTGTTAIHRLLIPKEELEKITKENIHPSVFECLMREGESI